VGTTDLLLSTPIQPSREEHPYNGHSVSLLGGKVTRGVAFIVHPVKRRG